MDTQTCILPGGYFDVEGVLHREAELIPLSGREEEWLAGRRDPHNAVIVTKILGRCVLRIGTVTPVGEDVARDLLTGDRQFLMLKLRQATFGERVLATLTCPWEDCAERIDIDFSLADMPVQESAKIESVFTLEREEIPRVVAFRLPNGADQEAVAPLALRDPEQALVALLRRCVKSIDREDVDGVLEFGPAIYAEIDRAMEAVAPRVDANLNGVCPECGRAFTRPFDLAGFFFDELKIGRHHLYREVHCLAYHYHWSEAEILSLPRPKRRLYIDLLSEELERSSHVFQ